MNEAKPRWYIDWSRVVAWAFLLFLIGSTWFCFTQSLEHDAKRKQEQIDKCVEQTGDARFCWEKFG